MTQEEPESTVLRLEGNAPAHLGGNQRRYVSDALRFDHCWAFVDGMQSAALPRSQKNRFSRFICPMHNMYPYHQLYGCCKLNEHDCRVTRPPIDVITSCGRTLFVDRA